MRDVGFYAGGLDPYTVAHIWKTALQPVLIYGVQAVHSNRSQLLSIDSAQASLVKTTLGLRRSSRSTPLLQAVKINKPSLLYYISSLELLEAHMKSGAKGRKLYSFLLTAKQDNSCNFSGSLSGFLNDMSLYRHLFDDSYRALCKGNLKAFTRDNGLFDTLSFYMNDFMENRDIVQLLLSTY